MPEPSTLALFVAATLALVVTPGPAVLYVTARSVDQGRLAGVVATLGIGTGTLFHIAAAALGVSALVVSSAAVFNAVKYAGAAYLVYLGIRKLLERDPDEEPEIHSKQSHRRIFAQAVVVNLLNPKTSLFFFAFLPQFVDPGKGHVSLQVLFLGALFVVLALLSDGLWVFVAGTVGDWFLGNARFANARRYFAGTVFITLGLACALADPPGHD